MTNPYDAYRERLRALDLAISEASGSLEMSVIILLRAHNERDDAPTISDWRFLQEASDQMEKARAAMRAHLRSDPATYEAA